MTRVDLENPIAELDEDRKRFHDAIRRVVGYLPHVLVVEGDRLLQAGIRLGERIAHERPTVRVPDPDER